MDNNENGATAVTMSLVRDKMLSFARENKVKVLMAVESGSRGWGFPGKDSDWDCRFIYMRPREQYLSVYQQKEQLNYIDKEYGGDLDIVGWDIRKVLRHAAKGSVVMSEWVQSPLVYQEEEGFADLLIESALLPWYQPSVALTSYLGMANSAIAGLRAAGGTSNPGIPPQVEVLSTLPSKKLMYYMRTILAAYWASSGRPLPHMSMSGLLTHFIEQRPWHPAHAQHIRELVDEKASLTEKELFRTPIRRDTMQLLYSMEQEAVVAVSSMRGRVAAVEEAPVAPPGDVDKLFLDLLDRYAPTKSEV